MSSRTASSSPPGSSPPPRLRTEPATAERPEAQRASQSEDHISHNGGNSSAREVPARPGSGSERKRRLTSTGEDVRHQGWDHPGGMGGGREHGERFRGALPHRSVSMVIPSSRTRTSFSAVPGSSIATAIDITSSPSPTDSRSSSREQLSHWPRRENPPSRISQPRTVSSNHSNYSPPLMDVSLPQWQADSAVSECPICNTVFSFWHRKHHCRKCGRVVCSACSPHRITIPRQFIVRPPDTGVDASPDPPSQSPARFPPVVDLTGDDPTTPSASNPGLGGGEEVRLCNPCVPDPNPNPLGYSGMRAHGHRSTHSLSSTIINSSASVVSFVVSFTHSLLANMVLKSQRQHPEVRQERRTVGANDRPQFLQSVGLQSRAVSSATSTRQNRAMSHRDGRPAEEGDFCPVCRRRFASLSPEHPIESRQAHTRECIENYLRPLPPPPTSGRQAPPLPPPPPSSRMLPFVATEKDCLGDDGQPAECTICMEDYEVGQTLARLECLCKFHKHCIVDWFERKSECPVHKLS